MALTVELGVNSPVAGNYYFSKEDLLYEFQALVDDVPVTDTSTFKYLFNLSIYFNASLIGTYYLPYTPGESYCYFNAKEILNQVFGPDPNATDTINTTTDMDDFYIVASVTQINITTNTSSTSATINSGTIQVVNGGQRIFTAEYSDDLDTRLYVIEDPTDTGKKFLTEMPNPVTRPDKGNINIIITGSAEAEVTTWFPAFDTGLDWDSFLSIEAPETQSAAWAYSDPNNRWEFVDNATWGTGEQTQILGWCPGDGVSNALYTGDSGSITVSGQFQTPALGVSEITWNFVGIVDCDVPWEYDILDSNTYDVTVDPTVTQMSFNFDAASDYQAIGFFASSPGIGPFSQTDVTYFESIDFQSFFRSTYWLRQAYLGNSYYAPIPDRGLVAFAYGNDQGVTQGVDLTLQIVNGNFEAISEERTFKIACDNLRKFEKADLWFRGTLSSYEGFRFYLQSGQKTTTQTTISNILPLGPISQENRNLRQLGGYTTRTWTLVSDYVSPAEATWLDTIASSDDVYLAKVDGAATWIPVVVTTLESQQHIYNRDLFQYTITVQESNYNKR